MMRRNIAAGNWKMNTTLQEGETFVNELNALELKDDVTIIIAAPYLSLASLAKIKGKVQLAAQNCHEQDSGAYTGEISVNMLTAAGVDYVVVGHSERRQYFGEDDGLILSKMQKALEGGMKVIYCCGEPLEIREAGQHEKFVGDQLSNSVLRLEASAMKDVVIAYEPIWAIGTGKTASAEQAQQMHAHIRSLVENTFGEDVSQSTSILYGGSVKPANAKELFGQADVDGGLVGGASLKVDSFHQIIHSF